MADMYVIIYLFVKSKVPNGHEIYSKLRLVFIGHPSGLLKLSKLSECVISYAGVVISIFFCLSHLLSSFSYFNRFRQTLFQRCAS